jgi:hypothetical protein
MKAESMADPSLIDEKSQLINEKLDLFSQIPPVEAPKSRNVRYPCSLVFLWRVVLTRPLARDTA